MEKEKRVLIVEDSAADAELIKRELEKGSLVHTSKWVKSKDEFFKAFEEFGPDIILCDYKMPDFGVLEAMEFIKKSFQEIPLIVVSGTIGEDVAVDTMKLGVVDYILKDRLGRLVSAVRRALEESKIISERKKAEQIIKDMANQFQVVVESVEEGITFSDSSGKFLVYNLKMQTLTGYTMDEANNSGDFTRFLYPQPLERQKALQRIQKIVEYKAASPSEVETTIQAKDGTKKVLLISTKEMRIKDQQMFLSVYRDITERKKIEDMEKELSTKDALTGLYNYRYLMERLESEVKRARRYVLPLSVIMLDIDYFKSVNDVYGHQCGDVILKEFAQRLADFARDVDIVTRYGGEEFVIVLPDTNKNGAIIFGERLLDSIDKYLFDPKDKKMKLKLSMGLVSFPEDGDDIGTASGLINSADKALLKAKEKGGNKLCTFKDIGKDIKDIVEKGGKENVAELSEKLSKMSDRVDRTLLESVYAFAKTISAKDYYTGEHADNMVSIVVKIGNKLNLSPETIKTLEQAAILHDLGKVGVPDDILHKKEKLTKEEYEIIKKHPQTGAEIIRPIHFLDRLIPVILCHHERFDGLGYSAGLKGKEIPLGARIVAVADVYQALVSDRPYRKAYGKKEALDIIRQGSGTQFDPEIVKAFLAIIYLMEK